MLFRLAERDGKVGAMRYCPSRIMWLPDGHRPKSSCEQKCKVSCSSSLLCYDDAKLKWHTDERRAIIFDIRINFTDSLYSVMYIFDYSPMKQESHLKIYQVFNLQDMA